MNLNQTIDKISFKQIIQLSFIVGLMMTIPISVGVTQKQTRLVSKAEYTSSPSTGLVRHLPPKVDPVISEVRPFIGKVGDVVIIKGKNFGFYPYGAKLTIGPIEIGQDNLLVWQDDKISFNIPQGANSDNITVFNGTSSTSWSQVLTIYNTNTRTKIRRDASNLYIVNVQNLQKVIYYLSSQQQLTYSQPISASDQPVLIIKAINTDEISWLTLYDPQNRIIPFYVDPLNFNF